MYSSALRISSATFSAGSTSVLQWLTRLYIDDHADDRQMEALLAIIGGRAGGFPGWVNECFAGGRRSRLARDRNFIDSPLEEAGFEPLVPSKREGLSSSR
jgi:hypothetical protein